MLERHQIGLPQSFYRLSAVATDGIQRFVSRSVFVERNRRTRRTFNYAGRLVGYEYDGYHDTRTASTFTTTAKSNYVVGTERAEYAET